MSAINFALTAVTVDEEKIRLRANAARGRLIKLETDDGRLASLIYDEIRRGNILASARSRHHTLLLLACPLHALQNCELVIAAKDASGEPTEILTPVFFQADLAALAPYGHVPYWGTIHLAVDHAWRRASARLQMLDTRLQWIGSGRWLLRMRSVSYSTDVRRAQRTARCWVVRDDPPGLMPTPKHETAGRTAYVSDNASDNRVPWKHKSGVAKDRLDKYRLLNIILGGLGVTLGMSMIEVQVAPLHGFRPIGSKAQAKRELTHVHVIGQVATVLAGDNFHVWSHLGRPQFMTGLMSQMFPFARWTSVDAMADLREEGGHVLEVVNAVNADEPEADVKKKLRALKLPVLQCLTDSTLSRISKSIERRTQKVAADAEAGRNEVRRPPQEHEEIARALLIQLLLKIELHRRCFLLRRPWMGTGLPVDRYAFICHDFGDRYWVVVKPRDEWHFDVDIVESIQQLKLGSRAPVMIDPPVEGKDDRGADFERLRMGSRRSVILRNTEINGYSAQRSGHAGVWLLPELFGYLSLGADAASSDLSTKVAPRVRIVEVYEHGTPAAAETRWAVTLDMAGLAYDPTVRLFRTSAFPIFVKLGAEIMEALDPPASPASP